MADEQTIIANGVALGLKEEKLVKYVEERRVREEKRREEELEREERREAREAEKLRIEVQRISQENEFKLKELELERLRITNSGSSTTARPSTNIKLNTYKDGEDISVFVKTFDRVAKANNWNETIAITALMNACAGSKVSTFIDTLPLETNLETLKAEIITNFGQSIYEYQSKFRYYKQGAEPFGQYVSMIREYFAKMCNLAKVDGDYKLLEELVIKDQIIRNAEKGLAEYLKEKEIFRISLEKVSEHGENFQSIHGKTTKARSCYMCGSTDHISRFCSRKAYAPYQGGPYQGTPSRGGISRHSFAPAQIALTKVRFCSLKNVLRLDTVIM